MCKKLLLSVLIFSSVLGGGVDFLHYLCTYLQRGGWEKRTGGGGLKWLFFLCTYFMDDPYRHHVPEIDTLFEVFM